MIATNPFAIMGLAYCFLGDRVSFVEITALVVSFSGIVLMAISNPSSKQDELDVDVLETQKGKQNEYILGIAIALLTACFLAISTVFGRALKAVDTSVIMFNHMLVGTFMAYILVIIEDVPNR